MKLKQIVFFVFLISLSVTDKSMAQLKSAKAVSSLSRAYKNKFNIGAALNLAHINGKDTLGLDILKYHFNSIVAENCMKISNLQPQEGIFNFKDADKFVALGEANKMQVIGHTLIWHSQAPRWFFLDKEGKEVTKEVLIDRMRTHIYTVVKRYKGKIHGWDVVNEAIEDDGSYRQSKFYKIIGEEFVALAFKFAKEADPKAELYYNDYSMANPKKREGVVKMVKYLQSKGIKVDGIGMQGHLSLDYPTLNAFEESILAFSNLGAKVMITEMDITVLPSRYSGAEISLNYQYDSTMNPYVNGLPKDIAQKLADRYTAFFALFNKHDKKISRVTLWGITDNDSWKNNWPMVGRKDYPLLFDRDYQAKPFVYQIIDLANNNE